MVAAVSCLCCQPSGLRAGGLYWTVMRGSTEKPSPLGSAPQNVLQRRQRALFPGTADGTGTSATTRSWVYLSEVNNHLPQFRDYFTVQVKNGLNLCSDERLEPGSPKHIGDGSCRRSLLIGLLTATNKHAGGHTLIVVLRRSNHRATMRTVI